MERRIVNPWSWQDRFGFVQANDLAGWTRELVCAGQASVSEDGRPLHLRDMAGQLRQSLDNLETVLGAAGFAFKDVVRLDILTTDVDALFACYDTLVQRLAAASCRPASTVAGVARLALPELLVEIEATARK